jgi:hypothetical protein
MNLFSVLITGLALVFTAAILHRLWQVIDFYRRRAASTAWLPATAQVTARYVETLKGSKVNTTYQPKITYVYTMAGKTFERNISLGMTASETSAWAAINQFGPTIDVRYNPQKPAQQFTVYEQVSAIDIRDMVLLLLFLCFWLLLTVNLTRG